MLTSVRIRKLVRDIWANKSKTLMIVLATAVGLFAFGTLAQTWAILSRDTTNEYAAIHPAHATLQTDGISADLVQAVARMEGVQAAEGRRLTRTRVWVPGVGWKVLMLIAVDDLAKIEINRLGRGIGQFPPPRGTMLLEHTSLEPVGASVGQALKIEMPDGKQRSIPVAGTVHDITQLPGNLADLASFGYIDVDTAIALGLPPTYNELGITVSSEETNVAHIREVATRVEKKLKEQRHLVFSVTIPNPGEHVLYSVTQSLLLILNLLGIFTLLFTTLLIVNTISAILASHIPQIGVMKAIGAPRGDINFMYIGMILIFGLMALVIAVPLSMLAAGFLSSQLARLLNFDVQAFQMSLPVMFAQIGAGLLIPLAAAIVPILRSTGITVREAISVNSVAPFGNGLIDRLLAYLQRGAAAFRYAVRNMFRRKMRLALTVLALAGAGSIFVAVLNTIASLQTTVNTDTSAYWQQDITVNFQSPYRLYEVAPAALAIPGVNRVEGWTTQMAVRTYPDASTSRESIAMFGVPAESAFIRPTLLAGRWLRPDDTQALVINVFANQKNPGLDVGSTIDLKINGQSSSWKIVGIVTSQMLGFSEVHPEMQIVYANAQVLSRKAGRDGQIDRIVLGAADSSDSSLNAIVAQVENDFAGRGIHVRSIETNTKLRQVINNLIGVLTALLSFAAVMFAAVGGLSLTSTMTLNVLERIREIGVLRAVGGSNPIIRNIILYEGAAVGFLSWVLGMLLSIPLSMLLNYFVGRSFFGIPMQNSIPLYGPLLWLLLALTIAVVASYLPARSAARLSVQQILAYNA